MGSPAISYGSCRARWPPKRNAVKPPINPRQNEFTTGVRCRLAGGGERGMIDWNAWTITLGPCLAISCPERLRAQRSMIRGLDWLGLYGLTWAIACPNRRILAFCRVQLSYLGMYVKLYSVITKNVQVEKLSIPIPAGTGANWCETEG